VDTLCRGLTPAVSHAAVVLDLVPAGADGDELVAHPLDTGAHVGLIAVIAAARRKADIAHNIVDRPVGHEFTEVIGEQLDDAELGDRQVDIYAIPLRALLVEFKHQLADRDVRLGRLTGDDGVGIDHGEDVAGVALFLAVAPTLQPVVQSPFIITLEKAESLCVGREHLSRLCSVADVPGASIVTKRRKRPTPT